MQTIPDGALTQLQALLFCMKPTTCENHKVADSCTYPAATMVDLEVSGMTGQKDEIAVHRSVVHQSIVGGNAVRIRHVLCGLAAHTGYDSMSSYNAHSACAGSAPAQCVI